MTKVSRPPFKRSEKAYLPPAIQRTIKKGSKYAIYENSKEYQEIIWDQVNKKIRGLLNRACIWNIIPIVQLMLEEDLTRRRGIVVTLFMQAQERCPEYTPIYSSLIAAINSKCPKVGALLVKRLLIQFRLALRAKYLDYAKTKIKFLAHLNHQSVVSDKLIINILNLTFAKPVVAAVNVGAYVLTQCASSISIAHSCAFKNVYSQIDKMLSEDCLRHFDFPKIARGILYDCLYYKKKHMANNPALFDELIVVDHPPDQFTHHYYLNDILDSEERLSRFVYDPEFEKHEKAYQRLKDDLIGEFDDRDHYYEMRNEPYVTDPDKIITKKYLDWNHFRQLINSIIKSSSTSNEAARRIMSLKLGEGMETEVCYAIGDLCMQKVAYDRKFASIAEALCRSKIYRTGFEKFSQQAYLLNHKYDVFMIMKVTKFIAHLLYSKAIGWKPITDLDFREEKTNPCDHVFMKYFFHELISVFGFDKLRNFINLTLALPFVERAEKQLDYFRCKIYHLIHNTKPSSYIAGYKALRELRPKSRIQLEVSQMVIDFCVMSPYYLESYATFAVCLCRHDYHFARYFYSIIQDTYTNAHRLSLKRLKRTAKLGSLLLASQMINWNIFQVTSLCEKDTTAAGLIFLKHLFEQLTKRMGHFPLLGSYDDPWYTQLDDFLKSDSAKDTTYTMDFFTKIGMETVTLGSLLPVQNVLNGVARPMYRQRYTYRLE